MPDRANGTTGEVRRQFYRKQKQEDTSVSQQNLQNDINFEIFYQFKFKKVIEVGRWWEETLGMA